MTLERRLNGWKAIAAFFGRDRTTVARWAKDRGLPIHYLPGGKHKTVFAIESELEAWRSREGRAAESEPAPVAEVPLEPEPLLRASRRVPRWTIAAGIGAIALLIGGGAYLRPAQPKRVAPPEAAVMADYLEARDIWARRTPDDIQESIRRFEKIILAAPDFAPARAGLADAWLVYREYGRVSDAQAFGIARIAAEKALALDPDLASAHRAMGFIDYWWDNDPVQSVKEFQRAIALDNADSQTPFWFANVLADIGEDQAAERYYERARQLAPGSRPIEVEHACAQWDAGRDALALKLMSELRKRYPEDATISNCLTWVYMGMGDIRQFAREYARLAKLRAEPRLLRLSHDLDAAVERDPKSAHMVLIADAQRELAEGTRRLREVPAFYASSMGDRKALVTLMREADVQGERWNSPSITARIAARWHDDAEIMGLLKSLRVIEPKLEGL